jgi:hypothetical protein
VSEVYVADQLVMQVVQLKDQDDQPAVIFNFSAGGVEMKVLLMDYEGVGNQVVRAEIGATELQGRPPPVCRVCGKRLFGTRVHPGTCIQHAAPDNLENLK